MKDGVSKALSKVLSCVLHPLLMPTYGLVMYRHAFMFYGIDKVFPLLMVVVVFLSIVVPVLAIVILKRCGRIKSYTMESADERRWPYAITMCCYFLLGLIMLFVFRLHLGEFIIYAGLAIGVLECVNLFWKMSAHLLAWGGLMGAVMGKCYAAGVNCSYILAVMMIFAGMLAYARIDLKAHTFAQTLGGWMVGVMLMLSVAIW